MNDYFKAKDTFLRLNLPAETVHTGDGSILHVSKL